MSKRVLLLCAVTAYASITSGCHPSQEEYDAQVARAEELASQLETEQAQRQELQQELDQLEAQNAEMVSRLRALGENVEELESSNTTLQSALEELRERERQAQARLETFRNLMERFRQMIDSGRLSVRIRHNRMVVELPSGVLFDSGRAELSDAGEQTLAEVGAVLEDIPNRQFQVAGHTDNIPIRGRFRSNWHLSTARAVNVVQFLVEQGLAAGRISAAGYADTQPVATNESPEGRQQNRRIEIALLPNLDELPDLSSLADD